MVTICCVKVGTRYGPEYVNKLARMVQANMECDYRFVCSTDDPSGITENVAFVPAAPYSGWWAKMGLFRNPAFGEIDGRILYLDLDVTVVGPLQDLIEYPAPFAMHPDFMQANVKASAVMVLHSGIAVGAWEKFSRDPERWMEKYRRGGDQQYLTSEYGTAGLLPAEWVVSYKRQARNHVPKNARVVCFHGTPKPHECTGWVPSIWR